MDKKYKLTEETIRVYGSTLYRIEALKDFSDVKKGDKGGFIENEDNLSQGDNCWIYDHAKVRSNAKVYGNAKIFCCAEIFDYAEVYGNAWVHDNAKVFDYAKVGGNAKVFDYAKVYVNAWVYSNAMVFGHAKVYGDADVFGYAEVCGDALIKDMSDYIVFKNWWSSGRYFTWTRSNDMWKVGCFYGTGKELIEKAYKDSEKSGVEYERAVNYVESILNNN